jgi:MFS family permease
MNEAAETADTADASPRPSSGWGQTFHALRYREFKILWFTTMMVAGGIWFQQVTLGWLAYELTRSPIQVAGVLAARTGPLVITPLAGVLVDRLDRRKLLMVDSALITILVVGFSMLLFFELEQLWHLYTFAVVFGLLWSINNPTRQTLVANSVPRDSLMNAMALSSVAFNAMRAVGPAIGGFVIVFFGPAINFLIQGLMFGGAFLALFAYHPTFGTADRQRARSQSVLRNLTDGFRYMVTKPMTLLITLMTLALAITTMSVVMNQMPVYAAEVLDDSDGGVLGLLLMALGVGGLIGTILIARFSQFQHKGIQGIGAFAGASISVIVLSQVSTIWLAIPTLIVTQLFIQAVLTTNMTIVQTMTSDEMRGRVIGVYQMEIGFSPLGGIAAGAIAGAYGVENAFLAGGISGAALLILLVVAVPQLRRLKV